MRDRLSSATIQEPLAATTHASISRGAARTCAGLGSINDAHSLAVVVFAVPCSPYKAMIGCEVSGLSAATRNPTTRGHEGGSTFNRSRSSSRLPPRTGTGNGPVSSLRSNRMGDRSTTSQPPAVTTTTRLVSSPRSRTIPSAIGPTRRCTVSVTRPAIPSMIITASASALLEATFEYRSKNRVARSARILSFPPRNIRAIRGPSFAIANGRPSGVFAKS